MVENNRLVLIGNGFDLAHGLKTSYKNFLDWYLCDAFKIFCEKKNYSDPLIEIHNTHSGMSSKFRSIPETYEQVKSLLSSNSYQTIKYKSQFLKRILEIASTESWVDVERHYFRLLKMYFSNSSFIDKKLYVSQLNIEFNFVIDKLSEYIQLINEGLKLQPKLKVNWKDPFYKVLGESTDNSKVKFLNFNYTDSLQMKYSIPDDEIIHIHGRVNNLQGNPIIFGYGDETDSAYQGMEDTGENMYLEHIKSFGYFRTGNYHQMISFIDSEPYTVFIVGHSGGLSDRVLLNGYLNTLTVKRFKFSIISMEWELIILKK